MAYIIRVDHGHKFARTHVEFTGGYDALKAYFKRTLAYGVPPLEAGWKTGTPIAPEVVPTAARIVKGDAIYDWLTMLGGATLVSDRFRDCVEALDPGRHQFFPVSVTDRQGAAKPGPFFMFNVVGYIDSIIEAQSNLKPSGRGLIDHWGYERPVGPWRCALDRSVIGDRACWTEYRYGGRWFVSDRLAALMKQQGLLGFSLDEYCEEVDAASFPEPQGTA